MGSFVQRSYVVQARSTAANWITNEINQDQIYLPTGYNQADKSTLWPVIFSFEGAGEQGTDNSRQLSVGLGKNIASVGERAICIFPQSNQNGTSNPTYLKVIATRHEAFKQAFAEFNINPTRIYTTGYSSGGNFSLYHQFVNSDFVAASMNVSAQIVPQFLMQDEFLQFNYTEAYAIQQAYARLSTRPIRIYCGDQDATFLQHNRNIAAVFNSNPNFLYTEYPGAGHDNSTFDAVYSDSTQYDWLLAQSSNYQFEKSANISSHTWK